MENQGLGLSVDKSINDVSKAASDRFRDDIKSSGTANEERLITAIVKLNQDAHKDNDPNSLLKGLKQLGAGWQTGTENGAEMSQRVVATLAIVEKVRGAVAALEGFHAINNDFLVQLPKGVELSKDGDQTVLKIALPRHLGKSEMTIQDHQAIEDLVVWLRKIDPEIQKIARQAIPGPESTNQVLAWGDTEIASNSRGANLIESRFTTSTDQNGDVKVVQIVQEQKVPWWGYQNLFYDNIGQAEVIERKFKADDWVVVNDGARTNLVKAKDLENFRIRQQVWHYGGKAVGIAADVGMIVSGTAEVGLAIKGAELLSRSGIEVGVRSAGARTLVSGGLRASLGATGLLTNAGINESDAGKKFNEFRGYVFVADITSSVGRTIMSNFSALEKFSGSAVEHLKASTFTQFPFLNASRKVSNAIFRTDETLMTPSVIGSIGYEISFWKTNPLEESIASYVDSRRFWLKKSPQSVRKLSEAGQAEATSLPEQAF